LVKRVHDLVHAHHGQSRTCRRDDSVHYDAVGGVALVHHDDLTGRASVHEEATDQNDDGAAHQHGDVLRVEAAIDARLVRLEDERDLVAPQLLELGVVVSEPLLVLPLRLFLLQFPQQLRLLKPVFVFHLQLLRISHVS